MTNGEKRVVHSYKILKLKNKLTFVKTIPSINGFSKDTLRLQ